MIEHMLAFFGNYLIELMTVMLAVALCLRYASFTSSNKDEAYFSQFTRELSSTINEDKVKGVKIEDVESYLANILGRVNQRLPMRNLRQKDAEKRTEALSLRDYVGSKHGLIASIQSESSVFNSKVPPSFAQLTERIMNQDKNWSKLFGVINIDAVTRLLDVLPSLFVVFGVFGTFIGISMALPEIAKIDFSNLEASGSTLTEFVINVTFAMKTSIAGIFYSVILTLLNTVYPIEGTRERTFEKVETSVQQLWFHMQKDKTKENASERCLPKIQEALDGILALLNSKETSNKKAG